MAELMEAAVPTHWPVSQGLAGPPLALGAGEGQGPRLSLPLTSPPELPAGTHLVNFCSLDVDSGTNMGMVLLCLKQKF